MKNDNKQAKLFGILLSSIVVAIIFAWTLWNIMKGFMDAVTGLLFLTFTAAL